MSKRIQIRNLKSIASLDYKVPSSGVHLLSGSNGSGKTTLLTCLRRIGGGNAFQTHFLTSLNSDRLDSFADSTVTYLDGDRSVEYKYGGERWAPKPRSASGLIRSWYPDVYYAGANAARITPRPEDFKPTRMKVAPLALREAANSIFDTDRFSHLKTINLTTGNRNQAFVLAPPAASPQRLKCISEKNFSLGELCVLKLLRKLNDCQNGSLVLIDELELALHPRAQIGLLGYLETIAAQKALTVIFSTHSVTLIKRAARTRMTFLEKRENSTVAIEGCFPAYALQNLSLAEERVPDTVIYVEDEAARTVLQHLVNLTIAARYSENPDVFPTVGVVPIGDFKNVVRFYHRNKAMLPEHVKQWIVLDKDVQDESLQIMASSSNNPMRDVFCECEAVIRYLPWTPEVGVIEFLRSNKFPVQEQLRQKYSNAHISLPAAMLADPQLEGAALRNHCKSALKQIVAHVCGAILSGKEDRIKDGLFENFAEWYFTNSRTEAMQLVAPLIAT